MKTTNWRKYVDTPQANVWSSACGHAESTATVTQYSEGTIFCSISAASAKNAAVTISTPVGFKVIKWSAQSSIGADGAVEVLNNTDSIGTATTAVINTPVWGLVDSTYADFSEGDGDLVISASASSAAVYHVAIEVVYV